MTRRSGQAFPVNDAWRDTIKRKLEKKGMSQADLARAVRCSASVISELLSGKSNESPLVPDIHYQLEMTPPQMAVLSEDAEELLANYQKLDEAGKARLRERAAMLAEDAENTDKKRT
jgi:transcriptional regulator with XRE-family HTH domain